MRQSWIGIVRRRRYAEENDRWVATFMIYRTARLIFIVTLAYAVACGSILLLQRHLIYFPGKGAGSPQSFGLPGVAVSSLKTSDGEELETWIWEGNPEKPVVVFFHGNAGNLENRFPVLQTFRTLGLGFVALDYRGYGNSTGSPEYKSILEDALLVFDHTAASKGFAGRSIILYGESLGTGVATEVASRRRVHGLVLQSPYTSIAAAARDRFPWLPVDLLLSERFSNVPQIERIGAPLLIVHGEEDEIFPAAMALEVFDAARPSKRLEILPATGHNDIPPQKIQEVLGSFLDLVAEPPQ